MSNFASDLRQFTGTEQYHYGGLIKNFVYTDGVKYFFQQGGNGNGAYWFRDMIATEIVKYMRSENFLSIKLTVKDSKALLHVTDGNVKKIKAKRIEFTDLEEGEYKFFMTPSHLGKPCMMLTSEY